MKTKSYHFTYSSVFADEIREYVALRQSMGYWFRAAAENLHRFDRMCCELKVSELHLSEDLILRWTAPREGEALQTRDVRITSLKGFVKHLNAKGFQITWPPIFTSSTASKEYIPYIYTHDEIVRILNMADSLSMSRGTQFHIIFPTIIRVLYGCGLRVSEALALEKEDVDVEAGILTVRHSKFDNSRLVPISCSLQRALREYILRMDWTVVTNYFFPNAKGEQYSQRSVYDRFRTVLWDSGISHGGTGKGPRVHDFRHTFAVHSLAQCSARNLDTYVFLPILAAYLGHKKITTTEKYLRLTAEVYPDFLNKSCTLSDAVIPEVMHYAE